MSLHHRMMLQRYGLGITTSLYSQVLFDPILTPLFVSAGLTGSITIGTAVISTASIASAIVTTAVSIGLQYLMMPKPPTPEAARVPLRQAIPYRIWGVGRTRLAGAFMLWDNKEHILYAVQAIAAHRINQFTKYWLHDDEVTVNPTTGLISLVVPGDKYGDENVYIWHREGDPGQTAISEIADAFAADAEPLWSMDHVGVGQAYLGMFAGATRIKDQNKMFPHGIPALTAETELALCWDFRDPMQDPEDESTWTWTQNCALIIAWHLCFNEFGYGLDYRKALMPVLDLWKEEADICDEAIPLAAGGTEPRYQCNGSDTTENSPKAALNAMISACDGHLVQRGDGARILTVGKFRESRCVTLKDTDVIGHQMQYDVFLQDEINRIIPKFTYPETGYSTCDADFFEDVPAQLKAGRVMAQDGVYQWVHRWRQARRLAKRDWLKIREKVKGTVSVRLSGINAIYSRWVRFATPLGRPSLDGKIIENRKVTLALTEGGFNMDFMQHPTNIDDWNPATDEGKQPPIPKPPANSGVVTPAIASVVPKAKNGAVYLRVNLLDPDDDSLTPAVWYRLANDGSGSPGKWSPEQKFDDPESDGINLILDTTTVPPNQALHVQAAYISSGGRYSPRSATYNVTSTVDGTAPGSAIDLDYTSPNFSARAANTTSDQGRTAYITYKVGTTAQSFAAATLIDKLSASPGDVRYVVVPSAAGATRRLWAQPENGSGIVGTEVYIDRVIP